MAQLACRDLIRKETISHLHELLGHREIRIIHHPDTSDGFARFLWDSDRVFLMNSGGSHHFAAARYVAGRLSEPVALSGVMMTYTLNEAFIRELLRDFEILLLPDRIIYPAFRNLMRKFQASFAVRPLPRPRRHDGVDMIFLPRANARSVKVAAALRNSGISDCSGYFEGVLRRQALCRI
jgi:hypothetical protein